MADVVAPGFNRGKMDEFYLHSPIGTTDIEPWYLILVYTLSIGVSLVY